MVAQGKLDASGIFHADQVLAKHDENYMPKEAADALKNARYEVPGSVPTATQGAAR